MHFIIDEDDLRILQLLQHDARLTNKEIADKIAVSREYADKLCKCRRVYQMELITGLAYVGMDK